MRLMFEVSELRVFEQVLEMHSVVGARHCERMMGADLRHNVSEQALSIGDFYQVLEVLVSL